MESYSKSRNCVTQANLGLGTRMAFYFQPLGKTPQQARLRDCNRRT